MATQKNIMMLPEWHIQDAVMLAWPHAKTDWSPWLQAINSSYIELTRLISSATQPLILCQDEQHRNHIRALLAKQCQTAPQLIIQPYNDTWCRDYGPITLGNSEPCCLQDFRFNGWGQKYQSDLDDNINHHLQTVWQVPLNPINFELEGGSIETDGQGTLLTTRHCLLGGNRNGQMSQDEIETQLRQYLGVQRILWLDNGALIGDDTDSHIDNLARFTDPKTLAYISCNDPNDPHFEPLQAMAEEIQALRQADGSPYQTVPIPLPTAQWDDDGNRLPASYINFLILNQIVIVPVFNCPQDQTALASLQQAFPNKSIRPIQGNHFIKQFGGPHCATMQLPKGTVQQALCK